MSDNLAGLANEWLAANVHNYPLEDKEDQIQVHVNGLLDALDRAGYSQQDFEDLLGDANDYVTNYFEQVQDPDLGFKS